MFFKTFLFNSFNRFLEIKPLEDILMSDIETLENNNTTTTSQTDDNTTTHPCKKVALSPPPHNHTDGERESEDNSTPINLSPSTNSKTEERTVESPPASVCQASSPRRTRRQRKNPRPHKVRSSSDLQEDASKNDSDNENSEKNSDEEVKGNEDKDATKGPNDVFTDTTSSKVDTTATENKASNSTGLENIKIESTFSLHGMENSFNLRVLAGKPPPKYAEVVPPNVTVGQPVRNGDFARSHPSNANTSNTTAYPQHSTAVNNNTTINQLTVKTENLSNCAMINSPQIISPVIPATTTAAFGQVVPAPVPYLQPTRLNTLSNITAQPVQGGGVTQCLPQVTNQLPGGAIIHLLPNTLGLSPVTPLLQQYPFQLVAANSNVLLQTCPLPTEKVSCTDQSKLPEGGEAHSPTGDVKHPRNEKTQQKTEQNVLQALRVSQRPDQEQTQAGQPHLNIPTLVKLVLVSQADELAEPDILALMKRIKPSIEAEYPPAVLKTKVSAALDCGLREGIFTRKRDMNQRCIWAINAAKLKPVVEELRWNVYRHTIYKHSTINN
ncbi:uncharacterized protein LOC144919409 [Branchiostoma floridae x Branchiostoma belcheri]